MDQVVADQLTTLVLTQTQKSLALTDMADRNLTQGMGIINTGLIQQVGAVSDDPALFAALQTTAGVPKQGSLVGNTGGSAAPA